jgi:aminoglycoside phosphotransferase (APT) family kinase protein
MGNRSPDRVEAVRQLVAAHLPGGRVGSVVPVGEGTDHLAYEVDGELIVRWSKEADVAARAAGVDREARLLAAVAAISPLPVPEPSFTVPERGVLAYRKLPGLPLLELPRPRWPAHGGSVAATLGELLTALHAAPVEDLTALVDLDDQPLADWRREAAQTCATVAGEVPAAHRRSVAAFLEAPPPADDWTPVFSHNDLGIEHVLVDPGTWAVTGVIDWSDAAIVDPAVDFGLVYRDLGPAAVRAAMGRYRTEVNDLDTLAERAVFYARCSVFEDLAYGIRTGRDAYVDKSLAAMAWLFPSSAPGSRPPGA